MPESNSSLLQQLLNRVRSFQENFPDISKAQIARHCGIDEGNFSNAIAGKRGISADSVIRLHTLFNLSKPDVLALFTKPALSSHIMRLQERGKPIRLANDGWVSREGGQDDPSNTTDITETRKASRNICEHLSRYRFPR